MLGNGNGNIIPLVRSAAESFVPVPTADFNFYARLDNNLTDQTGVQTVSSPGSPVYAPSVFSGGTASLDASSSPNVEILLPQGLSFASRDFDLQFSLLACIYSTNAQPGNGGTIFSKGGDAATFEYRFFLRADNKLVLHLQDASGASNYRQFVADTAITTSTSYFVSVSFDGTNAVIMVNGAVIPHTVINSGTYNQMTDGNAKFNISNSPWIFSSAFVGRIDEVGVMFDVLSFDEHLACNNVLSNGGSLL